MNKIDPAKYLGVKIISPLHSTKIYGGKMHQIEQKECPGNMQYQGQSQQVMVQNESF